LVRDGEEDIEKVPPSEPDHSSSLSRHSPALE
jgi:hypothetical protein